VKYMANRPAKNISSLDSQMMVPTLTMLGRVSEWALLPSYVAVVTAASFHAAGDLTWRGPVRVPAGLRALSGLAEELVGPRGDRCPNASGGLRRPAGRAHSVTTVTVTDRDGIGSRSPAAGLATLQVRGGGW
jgi:hypothetical protein